MDSSLSYFHLFPRFSYPTLIECCSKNQPFTTVGRGNILYKFSLLTFMYGMEIYFLFEEVEVPYV